MAKDRSKQLADQLHAQGLRKRVARALAEAAEAPPKARARSQKAAGDALQELRSLTEQLEERIGTPAAKRRQAGQKAASTRERTSATRREAAQKAAATRERTTAKRREAAQKAAATRERTAAKRSAAAKQGARTRAASSRSRSTKSS